MVKCAFRAARGWTSLLGLMLLAGLVLASVGLYVLTSKVRPRGAPVVVTAAAPVDADEPLPVDDSDPTDVPFSVPKGYVAERVAASPLIKHPMFASFDDHGRLYVACSAGQNQTPEQLLANPPDVIRRLEDTDGDGRFDKSTVFADKLSFPQGVLWHDGAVYTASPPSLWKLEDTNGDGVCDRRTELVTGFPFTGIADDLHGPSLGPDGLLYWGVGRFDYEIRKPGGPVIRKGRAPLVMRCQPDGRNIEVVSGAMGNPVEVAFSREGEPFACGTFLAPEAMGHGMRDAIIHCVYGGVYPVRDRTLTEHKSTGGFLPPVSHLGVAAGSGLMRARGAALGSRQHPTLFSAQFNTHKVARHTLERSGASYTAKDEDFVTSSEVDFHPTDVLEDADGSMLLVDTGGWFTHCPTSQIGKARVLGAIYRIRRNRDWKLRDPRGLAIDWQHAAPQALARRLNDPRFAVADRAIAELARRGTAGLLAIQDVLNSSRSPRARRNALWVLAQIDSPAARTATREALGDADESVRLTATSIVGLKRDSLALAELEAQVQAGSPALRREAATALSRMGRPHAVPALLASLGTSADRFLDHSLIFALIQIADPQRTLPGLRDASPRVRRGSLIALDQMENSRLSPDQVTPLLDPAHPEVQQAALNVIAGRPDWSVEGVGLVHRWLAQGELNDRTREALRHQLLAFCKAQGIQELIGQAVMKPTTARGTRLLLLEVMAQAPLVERPVSWASALYACLLDHDPVILRQTVATIHATGITMLDDPLAQAAQDTTRDDDLRIEALDTIASRIPALPREPFHLLLKSIDVDKPPLLRLRAARALGRIPLNDDQLDELTRAVADAGALTLPSLLPAYARSSSARVGTRLVAALKQAPGLGSLTPDELSKALARLPLEIQHQADPLRKQLALNEAEKAARLTELEPMLGQGDPEKGRSVFFSARAVCSTCHTIQGEGGQVGPDLSKIGSARQGRDLLEAILYPSASFARGFEPYSIATVDGHVYSGLIRRETADALVIVTSDRVEVSLPRSTIEALEPSRTSIMPRGLEANFKGQELADLLAYLQGLK